MDVSALLTKYDMPVPRYTSYPTAVHFNHNVSQNEYASWLGALRADKHVSLYVHIPFCHILCHYCGCHTKVVNSYNPVKAYIQTLLKEIHLVGAQVTKSHPVSQVHFGGGSPNFLEAEDLKDILDALKQYFSFDKNTSIALEADPRLLDEKKVDGLIQNGVTRMSLGVQDFDPKVQEAVNRIQPYEKIEECVKNLRKAGIGQLNFDLMIGLPLQTVKSIKKNVELAVSLSPDRFAVFAYAHVPWMKKQQKLLEKYHLPETRERFDMVACVKKGLESSGYQAIGIDHFAKKEDSLFQHLEHKTLRRNFQGYTDDQAESIISFGLSSITSLQSAYVQNTTDAPTYRSSIEAGEFPITRGVVLSDEDIVRRSVIEQIMCGYKTDVSVYPELQQTFKEFQEDGLIDIDGIYISITNEGWPFARIIASSFDAYFEPKEGQHARAV